MDELARIALGGDVVVPAARDVCLEVEAEDGCGDGVAVVVVVEEPAVEAGVAKGGLDRFKVHRGNDIARRGGGRERTGREAGRGGEYDQFEREGSVKFLNEFSESAPAS